MSSALRSSLLAIVGLCLFAAPASAYLDPGTGSYVFQMVAAALVSVAFILRSYWHRLRNVFGRRPPAPPSDPPGDAR
jgi:hypothetical protein